MNASIERLKPLCTLLLGAAYADKEFHEREKKVITDLLLKALGDEKLPPELDATIEAFDANGFKIADACAAFAKDPAVDKRKLLELISAVHDADDVYDFDEDEYLRDVAKALDLGEDALKGLALSYEVEELKEKLRAVTSPPAK